MKKISFLIPIFIMCSCAGPNISDDSSESSLEDSYSESSSDVSENYLTISEIKEMGESLAVGDSGEVVTFDAEYLSENTDNNEKLMLVADENSYIYTRISTSDAKKYEVGKSYSIKGQLFKGANGLEIRNCERIEERTDLEIDLAALASDISLPIFYEQTYALNLSSKGNAFGEIVSIEAQYIEKIDNSILLFYEDMPLQVHGDNYIGNGKEIGATYKLYGNMTMYLYKPGLELIAFEKLTSGTVDYETLKSSSTPTDVKTIRGLDKEEENQKLYPKLFSFHGYVGYDENRLSKTYLAFVDNLSDRVNFQNGMDKSNGLYIKNHVLGSDYEYSHSVLYPYFLNEAEVDALFVVTGFNTQYHAWQVYCLDQSVTPFEV